MISRKGLCINMKYKIQENFLPPDLFKKIKNLVMSQDFPWRRRDQMTLDPNDKMYFTYCFYNNMKPWSEFYVPYIIPVLEKLKVAAPLQVRANMFVSTLFQASAWHRDYNFECKSAILYLNDCDGGTELKTDNKDVFIKADANKMLVFGTDILHRALTSKQEPIRYIINFNYFMK